MHDSLQAGKRVTLDRVGIFADGVAVKRVGEETFRLCREYVDEIVLVDTDEICAAIQDIFEDTRSIVEPAGALAVAGIKKYVARERWQGKRWSRINSGANMNFDRLRHVAERADLGGAARSAAGRGDSRAARQLPASSAKCWASAASPSSTTATRATSAAQIFVGFGSHAGREEKRRGASRAARAAGYRVIDMTRQRDGQAARALHGRRARARHRQRAAVSLRISGAAGRAAANSCRPSARAGTSACSTTAITARITAACWPASRCRRPSARSSSLTCNELHYAYTRRNGESGVQDVSRRVSGRRSTSRSEWSPGSGTATPSLARTPATMVSTSHVMPQRDHQRNADEHERQAQPQMA